MSTFPTGESKGARKQSNEVGCVMSVSGLERGLAVHRDALSACTACRQQVIGTPVISLARRPRVMLVGQAPGQVEVRDQRPFAGRAGKTLFSWLARAGIEEQEARDRIYIAAITRCYPGPSPGGRGDRVPSPAERQTCSRWLEAELGIIGPGLIIPVGRLAIDRILGKAPLEQVIGKEHRVTIHSRMTSIVPLPHPSGASSWVHGPGHAELLNTALDILHVRLYETLYS